MGTHNWWVEKRGGPDPKGDFNEVQFHLLDLLRYHGMTDEIDEGNRFRWQRVRCPFHDDRNPSASVHLGKQKFHCHGCDMAGGAVRLIMKWEGLKLQEALRWARENLEH